MLTAHGSLAMESAGHVKLYLTKPVGIQETVAVMQQGCTPEQLHSVSWRLKPAGKHYSQSVPVFSWKDREGHFFRFEMGAQWGDKRDILVDFWGRRGSSRNLSRSIGLVFSSCCTRNRPKRHYLRPLRDTFVFGVAFDIQFDTRHGF